MALAAALPAAQAAPAHCAARTHQLLERFVPADCADCWADDPAHRAQGRWVMDWVVPAASGDAAALAPAALPDAAARRQRAGLAAGPAPTAHTWPLRPRRLKVVSGPALNGYMAVKLSWRRPVPRGTRAWVALVEQLPAGSEGNAQPRALVRAVAGPLDLPAGAPPHHTLALRWPGGAQPERLHARAWLEDPRGRLLDLAAERCPFRPSGVVPGA